MQDRLLYTMFSGDVFGRGSDIPGQGAGEEPLCGNGGNVCGRDHSDRAVCGRSLLDRDWAEYSDLYIPVSGKDRAAAGAFLGSVPVCQCHRKYRQCDRLFFDAASLTKYQCQCGQVRDRQAFVCGCKFCFYVIYRPQEGGTKADRIFSRIEMVSVCGCCADGTEQHVSVGDH